jgi:gamma-glutamylcyclotransferase (GGCT)/AIG2-like uncharacterized protein YtfP
MDDDEIRSDGGYGVEAALRRLATYGTLAPGRPNHHQLDRLEGRWLAGHVNGMLVEAGWGAGLGYVFESVDLPARWARLDAFEGPGYERVVTTVRTSTGDIDASIYVLVEGSGGGLIGS